MSAETSKDVASIRDEDMLRKMWQETEDFGEKKEIRSHMYKLREQRLREIYNNGEGGTTIKTTTSSGKSCNTPTHADSIADHSFLSLKSKEIRDSESPTRDVSYKITDKHNDQGWQVVTSNERSSDGKTHTTKNMATTAGSQKIDGGKIDYAAKNEQVASVYKDGDDKNFTKSVGAQSNTLIQQEAVGGDDNSNFKTTSTKTSSSSRVVTEHKSTSGDDIQAVPANIDRTSAVVSKVFTENIPSELKNHPSYIEGKTKVTRETKTLPDGSTVTTTRYETKGETSAQSSKFATNISSSTEQRSSQKYSQEQSNKKEVRDNSKAIEYITESTDQPQYTVEVIKDHNQGVRSSNNNKRFTDEFVDTRVHRDHSEHHDRSVNVVREHHESQDVKNQRSVDQHVERKVNVVQEHYDNRDGKQNLDNVSVVQHSNEEIKKHHKYVGNQNIINETTERKVKVVKQSVNNQDAINERNEQIERNVNVHVIKDGIEIDNKDIPRDLVPAGKSPTHTTTRITTIKTEPVEHVTHITTTTHNQGHVQSIRDDKKVVNDQFINIERQHEKDTRQIIETEPKKQVERIPDRKVPVEPPAHPQREPLKEPSPVRRPKEEPQPYDQPERCQPIRPGKSELDQPIKPTDGQYDTTYRSDYTNKKISVEVSATHDAFARSLRAISPERTPSKCSTPTRGTTNNLRTSTSSLRSSTSPEKNRHPSRQSPDRYSPRSSPEKKSPSPQRFVSSDTATKKRSDNTTVTRTSYNTDTITRSNKTRDTTVTNEIDSSTLTRRKKPRSRSPSPISTIASDIEFIRNVHDVTTDLDDETNVTTTSKKDVTNIHTTQKDTRPSSLEITTKKTRKVTERSPTSPLMSPRKSPTKDQSPKEVPRRNSLRSPTKELSPSEKPPRYFSPDERPLKRTDTYDERCRQILGITETTEKRRGSLERSSIKRTSITKDTVRSPSSETPRKPSKPMDKSPVKSLPDRKSPTKATNEFPSQLRKSPTKEQLPKYPEKKSPTKTAPSSPTKISEFPSQIKKSPEKQPLEPYPERRSPTKEGPKIAEFPSQIRKSPEKQPLEPYPERRSPTKEGPKIAEFPSQIRKSPEKQPLEPYPEKKSPTKDSPKIAEFPSQIRKSPEREPLAPYPERQSPTKEAPKINEFPSQIRRSPERQPLEPYPESKIPTKEAPKINEFPSQIRKSPERQPLEPYPERQSPTKEAPKINEFPSQIRRSPERQPLEPYPECKIPTKEAPKISEFPSQIKKSQKEPLEPYPERHSPTKEAPKINEFPSQIRKSPEREPLEPYPEKIRPSKETPQVSEFPSQVRKSPEKHYPEKTPVKELPNKKPSDTYPEKSPSQIKKTEPSKKLPEKTKPSVQEFPSQVRKTPQKEPLEPYPEKKSPKKDSPTISEFPSQIARPKQKEPLEKPDVKRPTTQIKAPTASPIKKTKAKQPREYPGSTDSSSDEEEIEEVVTETNVTYLENKIPIDEPVATKKFISALCREDEVDRTNVTKKTTEELLEREILENEVSRETNKTVKKEQPRGQPKKQTPKKPDTEKFIKTEKHVTTITSQKELPRKTSPTKKPVFEKPTERNQPKSPVRKQPEIHKVEKTKFIGQTEYVDEYCTTKTKQIPKKTQKTTGKITLYDIENLNNNKEDTKIHIRTHRIDDTINKKTTTANILVNGDITKKPKKESPKHPSPITKSGIHVSPARKPVQSKPEEPKGRNIIQPRHTTTVKKTINTDDITVKSKTTKPIDVTTTTLTRKTINVTSKPKTSKPEQTTPKKHIVTTTITVSPKAKPTPKPCSKTTTTKTTRTIKVTQPQSKSPKPTKLQNGDVTSESDRESEVDSMEGSTIDLTVERRRDVETTTQKSRDERTTYKTDTKITKTIDQTSRKTFGKDSDTTKARPDIKPTRKPEKCITTKTVIINNKDTDEREIIVDLQRSKSSREPTPDRVCPVPLSSDEDTGVPRYPDEISEPEDGSLKRKPKRLSDIPIMESEDTTEFTRISEITDSKKITEVDRVDDADESLLSVNKKISKFLNSTTGRVSRPGKVAPKVDRPRMEVTEDLRSDECLLSVSDKVSKFISTAEQLITPQQMVDRPKSPKCQNYRDYTEETTSKVSDKVSHFSNTSKEPKKPSQGPAPKVQRPDLTNVDETIREDDCLLSVSDKVSKFISTADKLTKEDLKKPISLAKIDIQPKQEPSRKSPERVSPTRFIPSAPKQEPSRRSPERESPTRFIPSALKQEPSRKSPERQSPTRFMPSAPRQEPSGKSPERKSPTRFVPSGIAPKKEPSTRSSERKSPTRFVPSALAPKQEPSRKSPERKSPTRFVPSALATIDVEEITRKSLSPERRTQSPEEKTPPRRPSNQYTSISQIETQETKYSRRDSSPKLPDSTPKSGKRPSVDESKPVLSPTGRMRSTETIKKAKALFENITKEQEVLKQRDILSRPSVFDSKRRKPEDVARKDVKDVTRKRLSYSDEEDETVTHSTHRTVTTKISNLRSRSKTPDHEVPHYMLPLERGVPERERSRSRSKSPDSVKAKPSSDNEVPHYMLPLHRNVPERERSRSRSKSPDSVKMRPATDNEVPHYMLPLDRNIPERQRSRSRTPDVSISGKHVDLEPIDQTDEPHYMLPLDRSLRPNSPRRENLTQSNDREESRTTKFGVTLRRTDSGRAVTTSTTERRRSSITLEKRITEEEIEDIFELEVLEELLEKVVGYELRRKIRTQIRLVKKLITENRLTTYIARRNKSNVRDSKSPSKEKPHHDTRTTEYQSKYTRKISPERKVVDNKLYHHTDHARTETVERTTEYQSSYAYNERRTSSDSTTKITRRSYSPETKPQREKSPDKPNRTKTDTKKTFTQLKKTVPVTKPVEVDKPDWARQRNLRKTSETTQPTTRKVSTTTKKESVRSTSPTKEVKPTDLITSSYGVGPTDENGTPLFGLKALRAQNKSSTTKVQGTVIRSEYYSANGNEPVGQVSVTKYSTDPRDLGTDQTTGKNKGMTCSVTTTQKFGYKDTPSYKSLTNKKKEINSVEESTRTTKVARKNSVKALSQKFIENAVETLKSERQTSYPKAGLILRTSSFKDSRSGSDNSRETSPANRECESTVTVRTTTTRSSGGDTFLTNKSRVSGVQDVISRMKTEQYQEGDTEEDVKARGLLNKFIGSQVILSGMESRETKTAKVSPGGTVRRTLKVTTTVTEGGKPVSKTRVFQTPINEEELEGIWDEQTLRLLLEQSTDYEERRVIRARLRQVMAEQEACTDLVEKASQEQSAGAIEGESLLLPLLQGLLEAPENEQTADSGTESGEDQRNGLIAEVQNALDKLSASLRSDATDITPERRCSLLQLVTKLQAGLSSTSPKLERRLSSGPGRFGRRRQRQNRHTVGVSSEELADARRLMEEISLKDITQSPSQSRVTVLQKQNSESSVTSNSSSFNKFGAKVPVKNATAKPFSSSNSISNNSSSVHTPTDPVENLDVLFGDDSVKKSHYTIAQSASVSSLERSNSIGLQRTLSEATVDSSQEVDIKSVEQAVKKAAARKKGTSESAQDSETEEDATTVSVPKQTETPPKSPLIENPVYCQPTENPIYSPPTESASRRMSYEEKCSRFNTKAKKNKMKRANTIDIPKSLNFYEDEDDDSEYSETEDENQRRKKNYYALRGPIRVGDPVNKNTMPVFEPRTQSDQKFLSFLNKNNDNNTQKTSVWTARNGGSVWGNKFGNIKNTFEKASESTNPVRNFWKTADDAVAAGGGASQFGPKISKRSARNLQQMFEEKQRQAHDKQDDEQNIVTGSLTLKTEPEKSYKFVPQPLPVNKFSHAPQSAFKPIPKKAQAKPDNLPIEPATEIVKTEIKEGKNEAPLYLYSPKSVFNSQNSSATTSPVIASKPWVTNATEHGGRVVNMAARKFETPPPQENHLIKPRKLSKDNYKVFVPQPTPTEKLTAPYLVKNAEQKGNTVRRLSGQYDNLGEKIPEYYSQSTVKYQPPGQPEKKHYVPNYKVPQGMGQNQEPPAQNSAYSPFSPTKQKQPQFTQSIPTQNYQGYGTPFAQAPQTRGQPQNYSIRYDQPKMAQQNHQAPFKPQEFQPVNYSIVYDKPRAVTHAQPKETTNQATHAPLQVYQDVAKEVKSPVEEPEQQYVSTCVFKPKTDPNGPPVHVTAPPPKLQTQVSNESVKEYTAINSKVMTGPVSQQAVTVRQKSPMNRNEHDMEAAFNLRNSLQKVGKPEQSKSPANSFKYAPSEAKVASPSDSFSKSRPSEPPVPSESLNSSFKSRPSEPQVPAVSPNNSFKYRSSDAVSVSQSNSFKYKSSEPRVVSLNNSLKYQPGEPDNVSPKNYTKYDPSDVPKPTVRPSSFKFKTADQPWNQRQTANENKTFGVVKPMQQKPAGAVPIYNNVSGRMPSSQARESLEINEKGQSVVTSKFHIPVINVNKSPNIPTQAQVLSKSDSWHQICMANQESNKPSPRASPVGVTRSRSSHTLAVPQKQFEAGMSKEELIQKKKTIEAFFCGTNNKSPSPQKDTKVVKRSINRIKTSEKTSAYRQQSGLARSRTLPDIICPDLLDESNVDKSFDDLFKSSS